MDAVLVIVGKRGPNHLLRAIDSLDPGLIGRHTMPMSETGAAVAITKLRALSEARANKVFSLIGDLAELEALENAEDLKDARDALAEMKTEAGPSPNPNPVRGNKAQSANIFEGVAPAATGPTIPYSQLRRKLGLDH